MTTKSWIGDSNLKHELTLLAKLAVPLMVSFASDYFGKLLTTIVAGHYLTTNAFDAVALGNTMTNITGYSMIIAFASPMDSLCTQANGARNWKLYSVTLHRALMCCTLFLLPTILLWLNMDKVLVLCGQNPEIADYVYQWTLVYLAMLPAYTIRTIIVRFLSSQGIAQPLLYIGLVVYVIWHPLLLCLVFVVLNKQDFIWFPLCNVVTAYVQISIMMGYITIGRPHHEDSFQRVSLSEILRWSTDQNKGQNDHEDSINIDDEHEIGTNLQVVDKGLSEYVQLLFAGIFSMCGEWWSWEVITLLVGLLGPTQLAVDVIYSAMIPMYYMIPRGFGMAGSSRVGTLIGENQHHLAQQLGDTILKMTLFETFAVAGISYLMREYIPMLFTSDPEVISVAVKLSPLFCAFIIPHGMQGSFQGILRGIKRQGRSVFAVLIGPWLVSIPLACLLTFHPAINWEIFGMWAGNNVGYFVMDAIFLWLWVSYDWKKDLREEVVSERLPLLGNQRKRTEVSV